MNLVTIALILFWLTAVVLFVIIAWRAMRAHESLARSQTVISGDIHKIAAALARDPAALQPGRLDSLDAKSLPKFSD